MPERRHTHGRRNEDHAEIPEDVERGLRVWIRLMFLHRVKLLALGALLGSPLAYMAGCSRGLFDLGALTLRVSTLETDVDKVRKAAQLQLFLQCLSTPEAAPKQVMLMCQEIVRKGVTP